MGGHRPRRPAVLGGLGELLPFPSRVSEVHGCLVPFSPVPGPSCPGSHSPLPAAQVSSGPRVLPEASQRGGRQRLRGHGAESDLAQPRRARQPAEPGALTPPKRGAGVAPGWASPQLDTRVHNATRGRRNAP
uniref:Uncharacterized protein n=1 Tax=Rousettus aegyptiacus TaxID=9407 RepID=A0A7J8IM69_ROUAE|nr:hypothetical protein HJG63_010805 [Rousettus aegyptiacus]